MLQILFAAVFIVGSISGSPIANTYFETVLNYHYPNEIRALRLDPALVPDFTTEFEDKVKIIGKVKGKADFSKGELTGLSNAQRFTECQGPYYSFGAKSLNCTIAFSNLNIHYDGKMKYGKMPKVNIKGKAIVSRTTVFVEVTGSPMAQASVKNFIFREIGRLDIKFTGLGPLNKFVKFLEDGFRSHVQAEIFNSLSQRVQYALNRAVQKTPLPN